MAGIIATGWVDAQGFKGANSSLFFIRQILPEKIHRKSGNPVPRFWKCPLNS
jgi:hypothetical protein